MVIAQQYSTPCTYSSSKRETTPTYRRTPKTFYCHSQVWLQGTRHKENSIRFFEATSNLERVLKPHPDFIKLIRSCSIPWLHIWFEYLGPFNFGNSNPFCNFYCLFCYNWTILLCSSFESCKPPTKDLLPQLSNQTHTLSMDFHLNWSIPWLLVITCGNRFRRETTFD